MKIYCLETEQWVEEYLKKSLAEHDVVCRPETLQDAEVVADALVLCVFVNSRVTAEVLAKYPSLKLVVTRSTGYDHIDLVECQKRGVVVCNVPSYGEHTVAEYTFALMLSLSRKIYEGVRRVHEENKFHTDGLKGFDLFGKTLGVIGTGRIGCHVIEIANGLGMSVVAYDSLPKAELEKSFSMKYVTLEELLERADVLTIHTPYLPSTHHLLNSENLKLVKSGAVLVNTARGAIVETAGLLSALKSGRLAGAALDVLEEEGYVGEEWKLFGEGRGASGRMETVLADHILLRMPNVLITPHNAFNTQEALERILQVSVENILGFDGGEAKNLVKF